MSDDLIHAFQLGTKHAPDSGPLVDMDRILDALSGAASPDEVARVVDLTIAHPAWAAAWADGKRMLATSRALPPEPEPLPSPANRPWLGALTAVAIAAAAMFTVRAVTPAADPYREGATTKVVSTIETVPREHAILSWRPVAPTATVKLSVFDDALRPVHRHSGLGMTEASIPPDALSTLPNGGSLLWYVEVTNAQGSPVRSSTFRTQIEN